MTSRTTTQGFFDPRTWTISYVVWDRASRRAAVIDPGDTLFMPDVGTARADFPGGDARRLYASIRRLLDLPPETTLYVCHD